jgi:hypothetical protein
MIIMESVQNKGSTGQGKIIEITEQILSQYVREMGWTDADQFSLNLQDVYETVLYPDYNYSLDTTTDLGFIEDQKVLGQTIPKERVVLIDQEIAPPNKDARYTFTLGHEFGHSVLHSEKGRAFRCTPSSIFGKIEREHFEMEAKLFAGELIMPAGAVHHLFKKCYNPPGPFRYLGRRKYWFTAFGVSREIKINSYTQYCTTLAGPLTRYFSDVSKLSLGWRVHKLKLAHNLSRDDFWKDKTHIRTIMGDIMP